MPSKKHESQAFGRGFLRALGGTLVASVALRRAVDYLASAVADTELGSAPAWGPDTRLNAASWLAHANDLLERVDQVFAATPDARTNQIADQLHLRAAGGVIVAVDAEQLDELARRLERHERRGALLAEAEQQDDGVSRPHPSSYR